MQGYKVKTVYVTQDVTNTCEAIKNYIQNFYDNPPTGYQTPQYVLFAADETAGKEETEKRCNHISHQNGKETAKDIKFAFRHKYQKHNKFYQNRSCKYIERIET